ncbi:MAG: shikimate dehydrogenase [Nitrospirae bacterium]|nr:MAG: shikimate dehydrogenase [Nitrospirota bacterium]
MVKTCSLQDVVTNQLDARATSSQWLAGIVGENPSKYAKSPSIWNPVLQAIGLDAFYSPFDVASANLAAFVEAVRQDQRMKGFSVTMPYKTAIIPLLDELDGRAKSIGAVNVVVRRKDGRLVGANTDGSGGLASLTTPLSAEGEPFIRQLQGSRVLLIGSGGAGKALAWYLAEAIGAGTLYVANRSRSSGDELCRSIRSVNPTAVYVESNAIGITARKVDLVVNATTVGQSGVRLLTEGRVICLEPYSPLVNSNPAQVRAAAGQDPRSVYEACYRDSLLDIQNNNLRSASLMTQVPASVRFLDIVYSPLETTLLRQARLSGHQTLNGKGMNICQAADALFHWVFQSHFEEAGRYETTTYRSIVERMCSVW